MQRTEDCAGNTVERICNHCWRKDKINEMLARLSVVQPTEIDYILTMIVSNGVQE
jgi:hypothetical protein